MRKTLAEFRAKNLRLLEQLCPEDPHYIEAWLKQFDEQNGIISESHLKPGKTRRGSSTRKAVCVGRTRSRSSVHTVS